MHNAHDTLAAMTELPTTFGKYYLSEKLATGGMAEIYLAKLIGPGGFEKQLVIKQIHPALTGQRQFVDLFVAEAKTLVTLAHGNIVPVYELGVVDDTYFIAMEYVDGPTLYRLTEKMAASGERMDPPIAGWIAARIAEGLDYAHRKGDGVIHRDVSPRNVMLSRDGEIKLVDFGIAIAHGEERARESAPTGSFPYMSPEQARREPLTAQTDLFSLGVLLWEMLVGQRLFARNEADATLDAVQHAEIAAPSRLRPDIPSKLDEVVMRALARDRDERWLDAGELLAALNRYLYSLDVTPGPRDVAALVARFCPPETRRFPTHVDAEPSDAVVGPRTAVIPRDAAASSGRRAHRAKTFATHVALEHMLERAGTANDAEADEPEAAAGRAAEASARTAPTRDQRPTTAPITPSARAPGPQPAANDGGDGSVETAAQRAGRIAPRLAGTGGAPPSRTLLVGAGIIALVLGAIIVAAVVRAGGRVPGSDAGTFALARPPEAAPVVAPPLDAATVVAAELGDAAVPAPLPDAAALAPSPHDAVAAGIVSRPSRDAGAGSGRVAIDAETSAANVNAAANATLRIGADPYAEIVIDGTSYGSTPQKIALPAGHHTVVLRFAPPDSPAREQKFPIDLAAGDTKALEAEFQRQP
jgi:tRNA A-37 threonylcarbamoyl transferase component Bud32